MRGWPIILLLAVAGCAGSQAQQLLTACEAHDAAVRAVAPLAATAALTQRQVDAVDASIGIADQVCTGEAENFANALTILEAELLRLAIIQGAPQ